jgi:hypothetical protein
MYKYYIDDLHNKGQNRTVYLPNCAQGRLTQLYYTLRVYDAHYINGFGVRKYYVNAIHVLHVCIGVTFILNSNIRLYMPLHRITVINCTR